MRTLTTGHHVLHHLEQPLQFPQQAAFEVVAALRVLGDGLHLLQRPFPVALVDRFAQRRRPAEVTMGQQFDLTHAEFPSRNRLHEAFDPLRANPVYAHKRP